jgi:ribosomal protein S18 acetylase RimI-like enzyme
MPEIEIRPAVEDDIPELVKMDHDYQTDYVWQIDRILDEGQVTLNFREVRLPRAVKVNYPTQPETLNEDWDKRSGVLVANMKTKTVGYICIQQNESTGTAWFTDLAVTPELRRKGIGTALILAGQDWADHHRLRRVILVMQSKNYPAVRLAMRLGYEFCGYNDYYFSNQDIALFFSRFVR